MIMTHSTRAQTADELPPWRQSCDRCYKQKLRCIRAATSNNGSAVACQRCLRRGAWCTYSASLPKGRPSMYGTHLERQSTSSSVLSTATMTTTTTTSASPASPSTPSSGSAFLPQISNTLGHDDCLQAKQPRHQVPVQPVSDDALGSAHGTAHDTSAFLDPLPNLLFWPDGTRVTDHLMDKPIGISSDSPAFGSPDVASSPRNGSASSGSIHSGFLHHGHDSSASPDDTISQLSQLAARLSVLHSSIGSLVTACQTPDLEYGGTEDALLIDDCAFRSVASWLVQVSSNERESFPGTHSGPKSSLSSCMAFPYGRCSGPKNMGTMLEDTLAASHCLLGIFNHLHQGAASASSKDVESCGTAAVVCPMITACHALLLNIYLGILAALQYSANTPSADGGGSIAHGPMLADMRLVLILQLCSYLIGRQCEAANWCLSLLQGGRRPLQMEDGLSDGSHIPDSVRGLELEAQQRLSCLRQMLRV